jgi:Flp pilus assembly pilin Flp
VFRLVNAPAKKRSKNASGFASLSQVGVSLSAVQLRRPRSRREVNQLLKLLAWLNTRDEEGQTMAEYGVVLAVITLLVVGALGLLSGSIVGALERVTDIVSGAGS